MKVQNIEFETQNGKLIALLLTLLNNDTGETVTIVLMVTNQVGVFVSKEWETNGLSSLVVDACFAIKTFREPMDGTFVGLEVNIKKLQATQNEMIDKTQLETLAKYICINRQIVLAPALEYAKEFDMMTYQPKQGDICKTCQYKRKCIYHSYDKK